MCTVQVLFVADVMRRTTYNNNNNNSAVRPSARSICRRLFSEDSAPSERSPTVVLRALEADIQRDVKERWNFDFRTGTPLPGRYQWVPVHPKVDRIPPVDNVVAEVPTKDVEQSETHKHTSQTHTHTQTNKTTTQSKITDFLRQRKRNRTEEPSLTFPKMKLRRLANSSSSSSTTIADVSSSSARD